MACRCVRCTSSPAPDRRRLYHCAPPRRLRCPWGALFGATGLGENYARRERRAVGATLPPVTSSRPRSFRSPSSRPKVSSTARSVSGYTSRTARSARTCTEPSRSSVSPGAPSCKRFSTLPLDLRSGDARPIPALPAGITADRVYESVGRRFPVGREQQGRPERCVARTPVLCVSRWAAGLRRALLHVWHDVWHATYDDLSPG